MEELGTSSNGERAAVPYGKRPCGYVFSVPVWGDRFVRLFLDVSLPSLLSPRNIPHLCGKTGCIFYIYTKPEWVNVLETAPVLARIREIMPVCIEELTTDTANPYYAMSEGHRRGLEEANRCDAAAMFLIPDHIYADGYVEVLVRRAEMGNRVVTYFGLRTNLEAMIPAVMSQFRSGHSIVVQPRQLVQLALKNLHFINRQSFVNYRGPDFVPSCLFVPVGSEGEILVQAFHQCPIMVYPTKKISHFKSTIDSDLVPTLFEGEAVERIEHVVTNSDELAAVEMSPSNREMRTSVRRNPHEICFWLKPMTSEYHWRLAEYPIRFHFGFASEEEWHQGLHNAQDFLNSLGRVRHEVSVRLQLAAFLSGLRKSLSSIRTHWR
jgi:hypothetical protein